MKSLKTNNHYEQTTKTLISGEQFLENLLTELYVYGTWLHV